MTDSRHILITAHHWFDDVIGGSFKLATELAEHFASEGHRVSYVCCSAPHTTDRAESLERGVDVFRYPPPPRGTLRRASYHIRATRRLVAEIAERRSIAVLNGHSPLQFYGAARALDGTAVRTIYSVHSPFDDEMATRRRWRSRLWREAACRAARRVERRNLRADVVQCNSVFTKRRLAELHPPPRDGGMSWHVVPGWLDVDRFRPADSRAASRQELGSNWPVGRKIFLTVRRLEHRMGIETLIEAADLLRKRRDDFCVKIGGSGSLGQVLREEVRRKSLESVVEFLGRVPHDALPKMYGAADCFVLPTRALECFGLIVLEAFACDTPVIASRAAAIPEIAGQQGDEWLFEPGNARELAEKMARFLERRLETTIDLVRLAATYRKSVVMQRWTELLDAAMPATATIGNGT